MIEGRKIWPRRFGVAALTRLESELFPVGVFSHVTAAAVRGEAQIRAIERAAGRLLTANLTVDDPSRRMTRHTIRLGVHATQRVAGFVVIEARGGETHDVGLAAGVLGVTAATISRIDLAVIAPPARDTSAQGSVARQALVGRGSSLAELVTLGAVQGAFELCVRLDQRPRREQLGIRRTRQGHQQPQREQSPPGSTQGLHVYPRATATATWMANTRNITTASGR